MVTDVVVGECERGEAGRLRATSTKIFVPDSSRRRLRVRMEPDGPRRTRATSDGTDNRADGLSGRYTIHTKAHDQLIMRYVFL